MEDRATGEGLIPQSKPCKKFAVNSWHRREIKFDSLAGKNHETTFDLHDFVGSLNVGWLRQ